MSQRLRLISKFSISFVLAALFVGCATKLKQACYLSPDFQLSTIDKIVILPPVDLRIDKKIKVDLEKQIRKPAAKILKKKGYQVVLSDNLGDIGQIFDEDLKKADPDWIQHLGPRGTRYIMILCLVDVYTKLTFGSTGNAELAGYLYDKNAGILIWHDKGIGQVGQGGLIGMLMKGVRDEEAISKALEDLLASIPRTSR